MVTSKFFDDKNKKCEESIEEVNIVIDGPSQEPMPVEETGKDKEDNRAAEVTEVGKLSEPFSVVNLIVDHKMP